MTVIKSIHVRNVFPFIIFLLGFDNGVLSQSNSPLQGGNASQACKHFNYINLEIILFAPILDKVHIYIIISS